jgi:hypothetical protein
VEKSAVAEVSPVKESEKRAERVETRKADADEPERRRLLAEHKAKRQSEKIRRHQLVQPTERRQALAFGGNEPQRGFGFFGN